MSRELFHKPTNCKCGNYREAGDRWVVIERRKPPASSQLKCLECGWVWWNSCNYVKSLKDWKPRNRGGMSDAEVLERIKAGTLFVDVERAVVFSFHPKQKRWNQLRATKHESNGSAYLFVEVSHENKKKKVALHRLVWMFSTLELVPPGFDVDHVNGKCVENPDGIQNLRLLESSTNRSRGAPSQQAASLFVDEDPF